ncbi:MAG: hypothetical protein WA820_10100, partial [Bradyrhizobium sp.]
MATEDFLEGVQVRQSTSDPLLAPLQRFRGKIGDDGIERISTQTLFDYLEVRQPNRGARACRGLANVMRQFGWSPLRVRGLTRGAYFENIRGHCRRPWPTPGAVD